MAGRRLSKEQKQTLYVLIDKHLDGEISMSDISSMTGYGYESVRWHMEQRVEQRNRMQEPKTVDPYKCQGCNRVVNQWPCVICRAVRAAKKSGRTLPHWEIE